MISIILVEPKIQGNIGAIARVMKNFGYTKLILVNPKCKIGKEARNRAKNAQEILDKIKIVKKFPKIDYLIGTSRMKGNDYNIPRNPVSPKELKKILPKKGNIGLVFGRESSGLTNEEVAKCDFLVSIPTNKNYSSLNLSQAVAIMLYELSELENDIAPISAPEKKQLQKMIDSVMKGMKFTTPEKKKTQQLVWKKILSKSFLSRREAYALMGFFKKLK